MNILQYLRQYFSGSTGNDSPESDGTGDQPDDTEAHAEKDSGDPSSQPETPSLGTQLLAASKDLFRDSFGNLFDQPASSSDPNEQPTNYNPIFIASVLVAIVCLIGVVFLLPMGLSDDSSTTSSSSSSSASQNESSSQVQRGRQTTPGLGESQGEDPSTFYTGDQQGADPSQPPNPQPDTTPSPTQQRQEDLPNDPDAYARELARRQRQNARPPGAPSQNPYEGAVPRQGGNSERLKKAMASGMNIETKPPEDFDPSKEGIPRNPASGRPVGTAPTPSETRQEVQYQQEQQQQEPEADPRQEIQQEYPMGPSQMSQEDQFLARQQVRRDGQDDVTQVQGPFSPFTIPKGTIIPITLETGVNNQVPGATVMRVTRDVYDRTYRHILIPRGSEVVSSYSTAQQIGQDRLLFAANRLNLPDGRFVNFSDTRAAGPSGMAGLSDIKDRHLLERFGAAGGLAVLGAVVNASNPLSFLGAAQRDSTGVIAGGGTFRNRFTTSLSQQVNNIIGRLLEQQVDREPTLKLRPGLRGLLIINEDINLKRPYYEPGGDFRQQDAEFRKYKRKRKQRQMRRAIRRAQEITADRQRTQSLRNRAQKAAQQAVQSTRPSPRRASRSPQARSSDYYVDELRQQGRRGGTFLPPRRGPTSRERFVFGPNYRRSVPPGQASQSNTSSRPSSGPPRATSDSMSVPKQLRQIRRAKRRKNPGQFREPDRPLYNRQRPDNRYTRGKENYRPQDAQPPRRPRRDLPPGANPSPEDSRDSQQ